MNKSNLKIFLGIDSTKILIKNNIPISQNISWVKKKILLKKTSKEIENEIENIFNDCSHLHHNYKTGFFLSVGGSTWIKKDSLSGLFGDMYLLKQIETSLKVNSDKAANLLEYLYIKNSIKFFFKSIFEFFNYMTLSFLISCFNIFKVKKFTKRSILFFLIRVKGNKNDIKTKEKHYYIDSKEIKIQNLFKFFFNNNLTEYEFISIFDWIDSLKISIDYYFVWKKFLQKNNNKYFYKNIDNSFLGIFKSVFNYKALLKLIRRLNAKYIIADGTPNRPTFRRIFFAAKETKTLSIGIMTKVMPQNNLGYKFNSKNLNCDKVGLPDKFIVSSVITQKNFIKNGIKKKDIKVVTRSNFLEKYYNKKSALKQNKLKKLILIAFTTFEKVNYEIYKVIENIVANPENKVLVRFHPLLNRENHKFFFLKKNIIDVTKIPLKKILKKFFNKNLKVFAITNYSSSLLKMVKYGFYPIWLKNIGENPIIFNQIIDKVGKSLDNKNKSEIELKNFLENLDYKKEFYKMYNQSKIYFDTNITYDDINKFIKNIEN